jgi:hypothetical protein
MKTLIHQREDFDRAFDDGTIWAVDENQIINELRKIEKDFDPAVLKKKGR